MIKPKILNFPNYSRLYWAGLSSELGSFITETVLMLFIFKIGNQDKSLMGITRVVFLVSLTIGGILGGPLGERFNRKKVLIWCEILRIPMVISLFFFQTVWMIVLADGFIAFFTGIFRPSRQALVNDLIPPDNIKAANSLFGATFAILHLAGPLIGAFVFSIYQSIDEVIIFDFLTYIVGIYLLSRIKYTRPKVPIQEGKIKLFTDITAGFSYVRKRLDLVSVFLNSAIAGLCIGILIPLMLPFINDVLKLGDREYGYMMALFGIGGVASSYISHYLGPKLHTGKLVVAMVCSEPFLFYFWINSTSLPLSLGLFFIWGVIVFTRITSQLNYISETVETNFLSRIHSLLELSFVTPAIIGGLIVTIVGDKLPTYQLLYYTSISFFSICLLRAIGPEMRALFTSKLTQVERDADSHDTSL